MRHVLSLAPVLLGLLSGCAHSPLSGGNVDRMIKPAFIARIEESAGPKSWVFRGDSTYKAKLKKLAPREADRRLEVKLYKGVSRFEVSDSLRANTFALLPKDHPWSATIDPAAVARALESFLVEEVPANAPDYDLLRPLGADSVVELVVEEYGMRSDGGRAGVYVLGYARLFFIGGGEVYRRAFIADEVRSGLPHLDPFAVNKDPSLFRKHITQAMAHVAMVLAKDLTPARSGSAAPPAAAEGEEQGGPRKFERRPEEGGELPDPDPL